MVRGEHGDEVEWFGTGVHERVWHSRWYLCNVGCVNGERVLANTILSCTFEQDVCFLDIVNVQARATAGMRFRDDERELLESILIAGQAVRELARHSVVVLELIKCEIWGACFMGLLRSMCERFFGQGHACRRGRSVIQRMFGRSAPCRYERQPSESQSEAKLQVRRNTLAT
jgi:hypothetical protein